MERRLPPSLLTRPVLSDVFRQALAMMAVASAMRGQQFNLTGSHKADSDTFHKGVGRGKTYKPNGAQECARRRRQMGIAE